MTEKLSAVLRAVRKLRTFSPTEAALFLGVDTKIYKNWENGRNLPNILEWTQVCGRLGLDLDFSILGFIDYGKPIEVRQYAQIGSFQIPERYTSWQCTSNRWVVPIIEYLHFKLGEYKFSQLCQHLQFDADYFYLRDQLSNFNLVHDFLLELTKIDPSPAGIQAVTLASFGDLQPKELLTIYGENLDYESVFENIPQFNQYLDLGYSYKVVETLPDGIYLQAGAADWIRESVVIDPAVKRWYHNYKIEWFKNLVWYASKSKCIVEVIELDDKRDPDCLFRIQIAS